MHNKHKAPNERHVAISILLEINQQGAYNNIALRRTLDNYPQWQSYQRAFVTELVNGTLRNQILIDHIIESYSRKSARNKSAPKMKPFIRELLRTAIYQIQWMDKVPPSAAVNEAVKLARSCGFEALSGFVNGILRNIVRGHESGTLPIPVPPSPVFSSSSTSSSSSSISPHSISPSSAPTPATPPKFSGDDTKVEALCDANYNTKEYTRYLSLRYSFPLWLAEAIINWLGDKAEEFCAQSHIAPTVTVCINPLKTTRDALAESLKASGVECVKSTLTEACLHLKRTADLTATDAYRQGHFFVMDEGAYLVAKALSAEPGQKIIDLCAAPGGKSFACAGMMENHGQIISCDIHPHKIRLMADMASRLGIDCITLEEKDASVINPAWEGWADTVMLDAPCSGFGIVRRKPDIKYTKTLEDVRALAAFQRTLLSVAATYVKPGGVLVYSTCTITREENEDNIYWFLDNFPFAPDNFAFALDGSDDLNGLLSAESAASFTLLPKDDHDGFFIARMVRLL